MALQLPPGTLSFLCLLPVSSSQPLSHLNGSRLEGAGGEELKLQAETDTCPGVPTDSSRHCLVAPASPGPHPQKPQLHPDAWQCLAVTANRCPC